MALILLLLAGLVSQGLAQCALITGSELGSTAAHSRDGVIPKHCGKVPMALIRLYILTYDHRVTCSVAGAAPNTFDYLSIVVSFSCDGVSLECDLRPDASLSGDGNYTAQFEFN